MEEVRDILKHVEYVDHPDFADSVVVERIKSQDLPDDTGVSWFFNLEANVDVTHTASQLTPEEERNIFLRYNLARKRIAEVKEQYPDGLTEDSRKEILHWYKVVMSMQKKLVEYNLPLVINAVKMYLNSGLEYEDMLSVGNEALLRAIKKFDVSRGYKFSTYATSSIIKTFLGEIKKKRESEERIPTVKEPENDEGEMIIDTVEDTSSKNEAVLELIHQALNDGLAGLTYKEKVSVEMRYFYVGKRPSYDKVGRFLGVSRTWVKYHEEKGLQKLKKFLENSDYSVAF